MLSPPPTPPGFSRPFHRILPALGALLLPIGTVLATDYYVSPAGSDGDEGTFSAPFATIQHAAETAQPGDTVHLRGGTYRETVTFSAGAGNSGIAGNEIVLKAFENASGREVAIISAFDEVVPGQDGIGTWTQHAGDIWKISLPSGWSSSPGRNLVMVDGEAKQEARWPNVSDAFNFDYREMAYSESGSVDPNSSGPQPPYSGLDFFDATYVDDEFPVVADGTWTGALIDLNPSSGNSWGTGVVTNSTGTTLHFRYKRLELLAVGAEEPYYLWNHLAALDHEGEAFLDVDGNSGPANTLYLWSPQGDPSLNHTVELRRRSDAIYAGQASHLAFQNFVCLGGTINCRTNSSNLALTGMTVLHAGTGLNQLLPGTNSVVLTGDDESIRDSYVGHTYGGGVHAGASNVVVENNVIRRCQDFGVATWAGFNVSVLRNTIAENAGSNIAMHSPASRFEHNHCYLAGLRAADRASVNTNGSDVDMQNTVVSYNWVHHNVARQNYARGVRGGRGIRTDGGLGGISNVLIHHNIIWKIYGNKCLVLWGLPPSSAHYGNSNIRAYNNSVDGEIKFQGTSGVHSIGGHDVRNNIGQELALAASGEAGATVTGNVLTSQGYDQENWPGNIFAPAGFEDLATGNFYLKSGSPALEAGVLIPGITDGFTGAAPEIGALEYNGPDARAWSAGAIILPEHLDSLSLSVEVAEDGRRQVVVRNLPDGRVLPDEFAVQVGTVVTDAVSYQHSVVTHETTAILNFPGAQPVEGSQPISISTDSGATWTPRGTLHVPPQGVSIDPGAIIVSDSVGGFTATIQTNGLLSREKLIPIDLVRLAPGDLTSNPVPLVVDTSALIASGEINPDGSNIRFRNASGTQTLDYWIESGLNSKSTLFWLRYQPGDTATGEQLYLAVEDPSLPAVSDKTVLTSRYAILEDPSLCVWYSANALAGSTNQGDEVSLLPDLGPRAQDAAQAGVNARPRWNEARLAGLPTLSFDGNDYLFSGQITTITPEKVSFVIVHRNEISTLDNARLISSGNAGSGENMYASAGGTEDVFIDRATRRPATNLENFTIGRRTINAVKYFTGEIAEILLFDEELETLFPNRWDYLREYASRKYALAGEARAIARPQDTIEPVTLHVGDTEITDFTILPDGSVEFSVPPLPAGASLPSTYTITLTSGSDTTSLPYGLAYAEPNYDIWAAPLTAGGLDAPTLDIEGDRLTNLLEYALDFDPQSADESAFELVQGIGAGGEEVAHLTFRRSTSATDALLLFESSGDLVTWTTMTIDDLAPVIVDPDPDGDGSALLYRAELPLSSERLHLLRLRAELLSPP